MAIFHSYFDITRGYIWNHLVSSFFLMSRQPLTVTVFPLGDDESQSPILGDAVDIFWHISQRHRLVYIHPIMNHNRPFFHLDEISIKSLGKPTCSHHFPMMFIFSSWNCNCVGSLGRSAWWGGPRMLSDGKGETRVTRSRRPSKTCGPAVHGVLWESPISLWNSKGLGDWPFP